MEAKMQMFSLPNAFGRFCRRHEQMIFGTLAVVVFLVAWEGVSRGWWTQILTPVLGDAARGLSIKPIFISSPSRVASKAFEMFFVTGEIWRNLGASSLEYLLGFLLAIMVGVPLGLAAGWYRKLYDI